MTAEYAQDAAWLLREKYGGEKSEAFFADLTRLEDGEPLAYLIGHVPFLDTTISLGSHPLIPRPETEFWVEKVLREIKEQKKNSASLILDLCAGSGCIGVNLLQKLPKATVHFAEKNVDHHKTIAKNIRGNALPESQTNIFGGDLFEELPEHYDYIFANPPYIDPAKKERVSNSVLDFEPHDALFGGVGGLELIKRIIREAPHYLRQNGILYIEHEPEQVATIERFARKVGYSDIRTYEDQYGILRVTQLRT